MSEPRFAKEAREWLWNAGMEAQEVVQHVASLADLVLSLVEPVERERDEYGNRLGVTVERHNIELEDAEKEIARLQELEADLADEEEESASLRAELAAVEERIRVVEMEREGVRRLLENREEDRVAAEERINHSGRIKRKINREVVKILHIGLHENEDAGEHYIPPQTLATRLIAAEEQSAVSVKAYLEEKERVAALREWYEWEKSQWGCETIEETSGDPDEIRILNRVRGALHPEPDHAADIEQAGAEDWARLDSRLGDGNRLEPAPTPEHQDPRDGTVFGTVFETEEPAPSKEQCATWDNKSSRVRRRCQLDAGHSGDCVFEPEEKVDD